MLKLIPSTSNTTFMASSRTHWLLHYTSSSVFMKYFHTLLGPWWVVREISRHTFLGGLPLQGMLREILRSSSFGLSPNLERKEGRVRASSSSGTGKPRSRIISSRVRRARKYRWLSTEPRSTNELRHSGTADPSPDSVSAISASISASISSNGFGVAQHSAGRSERPKKRQRTSI